MSDEQRDLLTYEHTQKAPWHLLLYAMAAGFLTFGWVLRGEPPVMIAFSSLGFLMCALGMSFRQLTVADEGNRLVVRFGPLPLFQRRIWYDDIRHVEKGRLNIIEGWGVQLSLRGGWVWSIWGLDCVVIRLERGTLRVGTDDAENLVRFLQQRVTDPARQQEN
jgi:hypothetical protein